MEVERITVKVGSAIPWVEDLSSTMDWAPLGWGPELNNGLSASFDLSFLNMDVMYQPPQVSAAMMGYALELGPVNSSLLA